MVALIAWAIVAIRREPRRAPRRDAARLCIGQGASTQTALFLIAMALFEPSRWGSSRDILMVGRVGHQPRGCGTPDPPRLRDAQSSAVISGRS
jgi:hypothetical protein